MPAVPDRQPDQTPRSTKPSYRVLVTGFGTFQSNKDVTHIQNPSSLLLPVLPPTTSIADHDNDDPQSSIQIDIQPHPHPIRVSYAAVDRLLPLLYDYDDHHDEDSRGLEVGVERGRKFDVVVHCGLSPSSPPRHYTLETRARRKGYVRPDVDGLLPRPPGHSAVGVSDKREEEEEEEVLSSATSQQWNDILVRWKTEIINATTTDDDNDDKKITLGLSDNAGLYLCEYIYYSSLAYFQNQRLKEEGEGKKRGVVGTKVVFLHVPDGTEMVDLQRGKDVVVALIRALVGSFFGAA